MRSLDVHPVTLEGQFVRLEPLAVAHARDLAEVMEMDIHQYFLGSRPSGTDESAIRDYIRSRLASPATLQFAVIDLPSGKAIGCSSYLDIRPDQLGLEIGGTWYARSFRGTYVNPSAKLLMLEHAFAVLGCERVQLKTDSRNLQSQRGIEKLGAKKEGVLRNHRHMPGDIMSGTVMYSILPAEWPEVKAGLVARLSRFG